MKKEVLIILLVIFGLASIYSYAGEKLHLFEPGEVNLHEKLGITIQDWDEIQILISAKKNYELIYIERQMHGYIGAWMSERPNGDKSSGPIYFYNKHGGKWYELEEMSSWEK